MTEKSNSSARSSYWGIEGPGMLAPETKPAVVKMEAPTKIRIRLPEREMSTLHPSEGDDASNEALPFLSRASSTTSLASDPGPGVPSPLASLDDSSVEGFGELSFQGAMAFKSKPKPRKHDGRSATPLAKGLGFKIKRLPGSSNRGTQQANSRPRSRKPRAGASSHSRSLEETEFCLEKEEAMLEAHWERWEREDAENELQSALAGGDRTDQDRLPVLSAYSAYFPATPAMSEDSQPPCSLEKFPGRLCGFCALPETSVLGQDEMMAFEGDPTFSPAEYLASKRPTKPPQNSPLHVTAALSGSSGSLKRQRSKAGVSGGSGSLNVSLSPGNVSPSVEEQSPRHTPTPTSSLISLSGGGIISTSVATKMRSPRKSHASGSGAPDAESQWVDELSSVGWPDEPDLNQLIDALTGLHYSHLACAKWSSIHPTFSPHPVQGMHHSHLVQVDRALVKASITQCSYCHRFGASLGCRVPQCKKVFHFPCAASSGAFLDRKSLTIICLDHIDRVPVMAAASSVCGRCECQGDINTLIFCTGSCGLHFHASCVGVSGSPRVRAGWQCSSCKTCCVCRGAADASRSSVCEVCDKAYHGMCVRPPLISASKQGWKCRNCRICTDCGARQPGNGYSSRWHVNYSVCDSCYQQRNKGLCCPVCNKAYRQHLQREMYHCTSCRRFVHPSCDADPSLTPSGGWGAGGAFFRDSSRGSMSNDSPNTDRLEYRCPSCRVPGAVPQIPRCLVSPRARGGMTPSNSSMDDEILLLGDSSLHSEDSSTFDSESIGEGDLGDSQSGMGRNSNSNSGPSLKKQRLSCGSLRSKGEFFGAGTKKGAQGIKKGLKKGLPGSEGVGRGERTRNSNKSKIRGMFGVPGVGLQRPSDDGDPSPRGDFGEENKPILCSASDEFVLTQDVCVMCGSFGQGQEGRLIACAQCGQAYHPYCTNAKVTKVVLEKGWRCLDCTYCEGCGQPHDEGKLILCDECDVSYHIYCLDPPLETVPHGNWKCKWCAVCRRCGANEPGTNCSWLQNYSLCGPCASVTSCPVCLIEYTEDEPIIQCSKCQRWQHAMCDLIRNEKEAEICAQATYVCILCRPKGVPAPHMFPLGGETDVAPSMSPSEIRNRSVKYQVDNTTLSESGLQMLRSQALDKLCSVGRKPLPPKDTDMEGGIAATIESVVAGPGQWEGVRMEW
ncbi:unnamed protein product, partial [Cyprideis torosa]